MKKYLFFIALLFAGLAVNAQENLFSINGGWAWGTLQDSDESSNGWRLSTVYEYNPHGGKLSHGLGLTYIGISADDVINFEGESGDVKLNSYPLYYQPKLTFGEGKTKFYVSGSVGMHLSGYNIKSNQGGTIKTSEAGFYGGAGAGLIVPVADYIYFNATYEWSYLSNSYFDNGYVQSVLIGLVFEF